MAINKRKPVHFKVHYQLIGKAEKVTRNYLLEDRPELMRMLWKEEGIATTNCEFMYIHMIGHDGTVAEVMSYKRPQATAVEIKPVKNKPVETRSVVDQVKEIVVSTRTHGSGRYVFKEAT